MEFLINKAEQLAGHLRRSITRSELPTPLPSLRQWSAMLSVSTSTLQAALAILKQEGLIGSRPRSGYYLLPKPASNIKSSRLMVRLIWHDPKHHSIPPAPELVALLSQRLAGQGIGLRVERCDAPRIQAISDAGYLSNEIILLCSLSSEQQRFFSRHRNAILLGLPLPDAPLPFISSDIFPSIRHAVHRLRRGGCHQIDFLNITGRRLSESIGRLEKVYRSFLNEGTSRISGRVRWIPSDPQEQVLLLKKLIPQLAPSHGMIVNSPLSPAFILMVLEYYGVHTRNQIQLLPINILPSQNNVFPPLAHYPYPLDKIATSITRAAYHYFQTGKLPPLEQKIPLSLTEPEVNFPRPDSEHLR